MDKVIEYLEMEISKLDARMSELGDSNSDKLDEAFYEGKILMAIRAIEVIKEHCGKEAK